MTMAFQHTGIQMYAKVQRRKSWLYPAVTYAASQHQGRLFLIVCKRPALLNSFSRLQLIQNSAPSLTGMRQCDIRIL